MDVELEQKLICEVNKDPFILKNIENQTESICLAAVRKDGWALKYVKDQTERVCLEAIKENIEALFFGELPHLFR